MELGSEVALLVLAMTAAAKLKQRAEEGDPKATELRAAIERDAADPEKVQADLNAAIEDTRADFRRMIRGEEDPS